MCSANAHGVLINVMCILHRETTYGRILLKQKFKQTDNQIENFATQFAKLCALDRLEIVRGLQELINENVLFIEGDFLINKRMEKDGKLSQSRSNTGRMGGLKSAEQRENFAQANNQANTANENANDNDNGNDKRTAPPEPPVIPPSPPAVIVKTPLSIAFDEFLKMRRQIKKPATQRAEELLKNKLKGLSKGNEDTAIDILNQSTLNCWQDLYELKNTQNNGKQFNNNQHQKPADSLADIARRAAEAQAAIADKD